MTSSLYRAYCMESNRREYAEEYDSLSWITQEQAKQASEERLRLITELGSRVGWDYRNTKADTADLSPGCRICGEGTWSCLFVSGRCNCRCFYCPARQDLDDTPTTQTLSFADPLAYADYVQRFGFKGVSISG